MRIVNNFEIKKVSLCRETFCMLFTVVVGIVNVQKLMRSASKQLVYSVKRRILLTGTQVAFFVCGEKTVVALCLACVAGRGLTAAADAAVGTGHYLDEVEEFLSAFDLCDESVCICKTVYNSNAKRNITGSNLEGFCALKTAHAAFCDLCDAFGCDCADNVADDSLGDAAGNAEDNAASRVGIKGPVGL